MIEFVKRLENFDWCAGHGASKHKYIDLRIDTRHGHFIVLSGNQADPRYNPADILATQREAELSPYADWFKISPEYKVFAER